MRMVDVDKLMHNIAKIGDLRRLSLKSIGEAIDNTKQVEVIPIAWIKKEIENTQHLCGCCKYHEALSLMLSNWEEDSAEDVVYRRGMKWNW